MKKKNRANLIMILIIAVMVIGGVVLALSLTTEEESI